MKELILAVLIWLVPPQAQPEDEVAALARYDVIASAIAREAGDNQRIGAFLATVAIHESTLRRDTHSGEKRGDAGRSWGLYQMQCGPGGMSRVPGTDYRAHEIVGVDAKSTRRATYATGLWIKRFALSCHNDPMCVFASYGGVTKTIPPGKTRNRLLARVDTYGRAIATIKRLAKERRAKKPPAKK